MPEQTSWGGRLSGHYLCVRNDETGLRLLDSLKPSTAEYKSHISVIEAAHKDSRHKCFHVYRKEPGAAGELGRAPSIACVGDSNTVGSPAQAFGSADDGRYWQALQRDLGPGVRVKAYARGGASYSGGPATHVPSILGTAKFKEFQDDARLDPPVAVVLVLGTNDLGVVQGGPPSVAFKEKVSEVLCHPSVSAQNLIVASPLGCQPSKAGALRDVAAHLEQCVRDRGSQTCCFVDTTGIQEIEGAYAADKKHLTPIGHAALAALLEPHLRAFAFGVAAPNVVHTAKDASAACHPEAGRTVGMSGASPQPEMPLSRGCPGDPSGAAGKAARAGSGTGNNYFNFAAKFLKYTGCADVEELTRAVEGRFGRVEDGGVRARLEARVKEEMNRRAAALGKVQSYASTHHGKVRRTYVAAQMFAKACPWASVPQAIEYIKSLWGEEWRESDEKCVQKGVAFHRKSCPVPTEFLDPGQATTAPDTGAKRDCPEAVREPSGQPEAEAGSEKHKAQILFEYLTLGIVPKQGHYSKPHNLRRAAASYDMRGGKMFTREPTPRRVCVTEEERQEALRLAHDEDVSGHWMGLKTWHRLKASAYWPGYKEDCVKYASSCVICQERGGTDLKVKAPMGTIPYSTKPFRLVAVDLKQLPTTSEGHKWMAVAVCHSTKFVEAAPLVDKTAESVAEFLFRDVFARYGVVRYMLTDRGREFSNGIADALAEKLGVSRRCTSPYHPQANGVAERTIGVLSDRLAKCAMDAGASWPSRLPAALMAMRTSVNFSTGYAPLELLTGREFVTPMHAELNGVDDISPEEISAADAEQDANGKAAENERLEYDAFVQNYDRICNPR